MMELMSPAGSFESLSAAIKAGCNSIYFGVEQLNMRARSSNNFTLEDLREITQQCKSYQVKAYLTLNTILYDHDLQLMRRILDTAKDNNISAVIASDHAVMNYARKIDLPLHISTQANVSNIETIEFYSTFSDVVVLARELSLQQVSEICREIIRREIKGPSGNLIKIEVFGHGALCMAISGKCYLSLHSHFASANRGACIQNCRRSYVVTDKEEGVELEVDHEYIMSAKDLCTIDFLPQIIRAGVSVLKIEGRGRSADYVYTTTQCYREAIDAILEGTYCQEKVIEWKEKLTSVYNRGFWDGYYLGRKIGEWCDENGSKSTRKKVFVAQASKYFSKLGVGEFLCQAQSLSVGDEFVIIGPTTGFLKSKVDQLMLGGTLVDQVRKGDLFSISVPEKIRPSDKLYKWVVV